MYRIFHSVRILWLVLVIGNLAIASEVFRPEDLLKTKTCTDLQISPEGQWIAYTVQTQRDPNDKPGSAYQELFLVLTQTGEIQPFITGKVNVQSPRWSPDGISVAFLMKREENTCSQVWMISTKGGEAIQLTESETDITEFRWSPNGKKIAYIAAEPQTEREKHLKEKGYGFIFYEENLKHKNLYLTEVIPFGMKSKAEQLTEGVTVWDFEFSPFGNTIAIAMSEKNLIDHQYMFKKLCVLDISTKALRQVAGGQGKLGNFAFNPNGDKIAYTAASELKDHAVSQAYVISVAGGDPVNLTPTNFRGHVDWVGWKDVNTVVYRAGEGVWPTLSTVNANGGPREVILNSQETSVIFDPPSHTKDFKHFAFIGSTPTIPADVYYWEYGNELKQLTTLNSWLEDRKLGEQKIMRYPARDGQEIEGLLIYPVDYQSSTTYPLIIIVHGGPESHYSNEWITRYSEPGQVLAGKGYAVFYPNYRASTGYGVKFAMAGYGDPAGKEFDDVADGIGYLITRGIVDSSRVGLGGGSYGGYAAAWFASYYTRYVKAVSMFVGISDLISKRSTTDIPYEELYVHSGKRLEEMWDLSLKRSPIFYAHQSRTAVLILGGTDDSRVHPSQSMEFYRQLKLNDHPAVRYVQYPGEGHGNRKQPGRIDVLFRQLQWYDWYVRDKNPIDGPLPLLDISDVYGIKMENK